ncbi:unnamed protein product [Peronospora effusa]|nr:unnamed protein product [Peronospora effusa]
MDMSTVKVTLALEATWGVPAKHEDIPNAYVKADKKEHLKIQLHVSQAMEATRTHSRNSAPQTRRRSCLSCVRACTASSRPVDSGVSSCTLDCWMLVLASVYMLYWKVDDGQLVVVGVYVDDLLATGTDAAAVDRFFDQLGSLSIKDLGTVSKFLGMRVEIDGDGTYVLDQSEAIGELVREHGLENDNSTRAPIGADCYDVQPEYGTLLGLSGKDRMQGTRTFQSLVGSLLWVVRCTRPDIAFAVHKETRQTHQPRVHELKLAKRIARYLKGTHDFKLQMTPTKSSNGELQLESYSDADFADKSDRKSLTCGIIRLNGMPVSWTVKKQGGVSLSTMEAEFVAASEQARKLLGIREILCEIVKPPAFPMVSHVDNQAAIKQSAGEASSLKAKHIDVRVKFVCDIDRRGVVAARFVRSEFQLADLLTKALDAAKLAKMCKLLRLGNSQ